MDQVSKRNLAGLDEQFYERPMAVPGARYAVTIRATPHKYLCDVAFISPVMEPPGRAFLINFHNKVNRLPSRDDL
jgi:hypothetical protein